MQKRNLHIFHDDKFTDGAMDQFEAHYPGENFYIILSANSGELYYTTARKDAVVLSLRDTNILKIITNIIRDNQVVNLFVHYIDSYKAAVAVSILKAFKAIRLYWIFYGGDLYGYLERHHNLQLIDRKNDRRKDSLVKNAIKAIKYLFWFRMTPDEAIRRLYLRVDYFCFWNEFDYALFTKHFKSNAKYLPFIYYNALGKPVTALSAERKYVLVNHAASPSGNHFTILDVVEKTDLAQANLQVLLPLSYGNMDYAGEVSTSYQEKYTARVEILRDFLPMATYQEMLQQVSVAFFGMRRQEAAGNIFQLLNMGARIFLREENSLYKWLINRGFIVFSLEKDFQGADSLQSLPHGDMLHNQSLYKQYFSAEKYAEMMHNLIQD